MNETPKTASPGKLSSRMAMAFVLAAGTTWGSIGLFSRGLSSAGISPASIAIVRNVGSCLMLFFFFLLADRSVFRIQLRHLPYFFGTGFLSVFLFTTCYFRNLEISSLAVAAILLYTAPAIVVILSTIVFKDKLTKKKLSALIITFLGCTFVSGIWNSGSLSISIQGLLFGLGSGFFYALYSIFSRVALRYYKPFTVTFYTFVIAAISSLIFCLDTGEISYLLSSPRTILFGLGLVFFATVLPYLFYTKGLNDLGDSGKASILASVEPVVASLIGILVFGEAMTIGVILGLLCILVSVYILR